MAFHTGDYDTYVLLGDAASRPLWHWSNWQQLVPKLDPLVQAARGKPALRSTQFISNQRSTVKFGRIGWDEKSHQKWTHGSPVSSPASTNWKFLSVELWAPSWTECERQGLAPHVFLSVSSEAVTSSAQAFEPVVLLAVASEVAGREQILVTAAVDQLVQVIAAKLVAFQRRPWGRSVGRIGFTNAIQDLHVSGLFKPGRRHDRPVDLDLFADAWQPMPAVRPAP